MKYLIVAILFIFSLGYAGYYFYMFDKKQISNEVVSVTEKNKKIPEHLTKEFWEQATPEQLSEKLKSIKNINEARADTQETMFILLIKYGQYHEMIDTLVNAGANYNQKIKLFDDKIHGIKFATPLHWTVTRKEKSYDFTKTLLKYYKNIDTPDEMYKLSPLQWALYYRMPIKTIKLLLSAGANPNFRNKYNSSPLLSASVPNHEGVSFINPKAIQLLLDYKADIKRKNNKGKTAYDYMKENEEFAKTNLFKKISSYFQ